MTNHTAPAIAALTKPTGILVAVRRSKTDQDGHGQLVGVARGQHRQTDPIGALEAWLKVRPRRPRRSSPGSTHPEPPPPNASPPSGQQTRPDRANAAGFEGLPVTGHSLRAGHATTASLNGAPIERIAAQTRHRDLSTLLNHYIRPAEALATSTSRDLGL